MFENLNKKKDRLKNKSNEETKLDETAQLNNLSITLSDKKKLNTPIDLKIKIDLCDLEEIFTSLIK